jgi:hypothetical protein
MEMRSMGSRKERWFAIITEDWIERTSSAVQILRFGIIVRTRAKKFR